MIFESTFMNTLKSSNCRQIFSKYSLDDVEIIYWHGDYIHVAPSHRATCQSHIVVGDDFFRVYSSNCATNFVVVRKLSLPLKEKTLCLNCEEKTP
jgi:hypothetical protein